MFNKFRGVKKHYFSGEEIRTIGLSLAYKKQSLYRDEPGFTTLTSYGKTRQTIKEQVEMNEWQPDASYAVSLSRKQARSIGRALLYVSKNQEHISNSQMSLENKANLRSEDWSLGVLDREVMALGNEFDNMASSLVYSALFLYGKLKNQTTLFPVKSTAANPNIIATAARIPEN